MYVVKRRGRDGRILWRCAKSRSCSGGVTTLDLAVASNRARRNHPVDTAEIKAHKIWSPLKTKTLQPLPTLYSQDFSQFVIDPNPDDV